jgi:hypothetical protein
MSTDTIVTKIMQTNNRKHTLKSKSPLTLNRPLVYKCRHRGLSVIFDMVEMGPQWNHLISIIKK